MTDPEQPVKRPYLSRDELEEIPVEDLIRLTREFTRRISNQDRQGLLAEDLRASGHSERWKISAPVTLQQFLAGEVDLDTDLARRFQNAPLLSHVRFNPRRGEPIRRQATAIFGSQDDAAMMTVDVHWRRDGEMAVVFTVTMFSALSLCFALDPLVENDRRRWLQLMNRDDGIAFLWTLDRWEAPYLIFVVREQYARIYAFSPGGAQAAVRMTPNMTNALRDWIGSLWFPSEYAHDTEADEDDDSLFEQHPTLPQHPAGLTARAPQDDGRAPAPSARPGPAGEPDLSGEPDFPGEPDVSSDWHEETDLDADNLEW
jgi:hypothetical protein